jgi:copper(I)-binding protein
MHRFAGLTAFCAAFVGLVAASQGAWSADISIQHAWAGATPPRATIGRAFMTIINTSAQTDHLLSATADIAHSAQISGIRFADSVMHMRPLANLDIPPGSSVEFKPGSYHVMLMNLKKPLTPGDTFKGTLTFEKSGVITVEYKVEAGDKMAPSAE